MTLTATEPNAVSILQTPVTIVVRGAPGGLAAGFRARRALVLPARHQLQEVDRQRDRAAHQLRLYEL